MRRTSKRFSAGTVLATLIISASPNAVLALATPNASVGSSGSSAFCTTLPDKVSTITGKLSDNKTKVQAAWSTQDAKLLSLADATDAKVTDARTKAATARAAEYTKLEAKAKTDAEKQAVKTYEVSVNSAISTRQAAYDAAVASFRSSVSDTVTARRSTLTSQVGTFVSSASSAANTAEYNCNVGAADSTVRTTLIASLKSARETYVSDRKDDTKVAAQVKALAATRDAAFKTADTAFRSSMQSADSTLKAAFGKDASSV